MNQTNDHKNKLQKIFRGKKINDTIRITQNIFEKMK